jgi:predicted Zn-dependent protease
MKKQEADVPAVLTYLSTHPDTEARIEKLRALAAQAQQQSIKLLPDYGWREIDKICQAAGR